MLVGSGKTERELYMECTRLKRRGYKHVSVLRGGLASWIAAGLPLAGHAPSQSEAARLSPDEFWQESQDPDNLVLLATQQSALQSDVPLAAVLPHVGVTEVRAVLERRRKETKNAPLASIVLAIDGSVSVSDVETLQHALLPIPVLVYREGRAPLTRQIALKKRCGLHRHKDPSSRAVGSSDGWTVDCSWAPSSGRQRLPGRPETSRRQGVGCALP